MRLGIAVGEYDPWNFFDEIYADLTIDHVTTVFQRRVFKLPVFNTRVNKYLFARDMQRFLRTNEVVFFEWASNLLKEASYFSKTCGVVTRLHRYELYQWADQINWEFVDRVILVSRAMKREFISRFPQQAAKTVVSSPSIKLDKFFLQPKPFNGDLGILCHLTPRKRVYDLILTFYELLQKNDEFHLHIGGGPHVAYEDYHQALRQIVNKLGLQEKVTFYGAVSETWKWYHTIDIFISNSYSEGLQVAPMEAMASGCYCLSHYWAGAEELLPKENLFYTGSNLQEKILMFTELSEPEKRRQKAKMRTLACEKFDINQTISQIRQVIEEIGNSQLSKPTTKI